MTEEQEGKKRSRSMYETIMEVPGAKAIGAPPDRKKAADRLVSAYQDSTSRRDEGIMERFADSVNQPPRSIGERMEEDEL